MTTVRRRLQWTTGLLVGLHALSTLFAVGTWQGVLVSSAQEQRIDDLHVQVDLLREAIRERYVHEAHTFIEGGTGHLDHLGEIDDLVDARLAEVAALPLPDETRAALAAVHTDLDRSRAYFSGAVLPKVYAQALDRPTATALHAKTELLAADLSVAVGRVSTALAAAQAEQRQAVTTATARAWQASAVFMAGSVLFAVLLSRSLAVAVLGPLERLRAASEAFGRGKRLLSAGPADDELALACATFDRMTEQVTEAERARVNAERLAALGELSAAVAHELANPLTVILGHRAMQDPALAPVLEEARHAKRVIEGLLGFARPVEGGMERVDLGAAVRAAVARAALHDHDDRVVAFVLMDDSIDWPAGGIRQVLDNLITNAVASGGGASIEVALLAGPVIEVRDRGRGISPAIRARLYQPFVTDRPDGTGLGLAVCQRVVHAQGGTLSHEDRPGGGTIARWVLHA